MRAVLYTLFMTWVFVSNGSIQSKEQFMAGFQEVRRLMTQGEWGTAREKLCSLLEAHREKDYVKRIRVEIEDCVRTCGFWGSYDKPKPNSVVSGKLLRYDRNSGSIKLKYTPGEADDFKKKRGRSSSENKDVFVHPALFSGPYSIEIKGSSYPPMSSSSGGIVPTIDVCREGDEGYSVIYGFETVETKKLVRHYPASILHWKGGGGVESCSAPSLARTKRSFRLKVKVSKTEICAYYNGKLFLRTSKPDSLYGSFAFSHIPFKEILIQGKVQPAWVQARCDAAVQAARADFEKSYDPEKHLPGWLLETPSDRSSRSTGKETEFEFAVKLPGSRHPKQDISVSKAIQYFNQGQFEEGLKFLDELTEENISPAAKEFLITTFLEAQGKYLKALDHCERVCELDPDFIYSRMKRASFYAALKEKEKAIGLYRQLIKKYPQEETIYKELAELLLILERADEAREVIFQAAKNGIRSKQLDQIDRMVAKSLNGPTWIQVCDIKTAHYQILSNIDRKTCLQASKVLEDAYFMYTLHLQKIKGLDKKKFLLYLFAGEPGYKAYLKDMLQMDMPIQSAGMYIPPLRQLLIWNLPDRDAMMRTVRHEGFHQYLHRLMEDPPRWLDEGLAQYYEIAKREKGQWIVGERHPEIGKALKYMGFRWIPLDRFLYMGATEFLKNQEAASINYVQSWAFVHFLLHSTEENRLLFRKLFEILQRDIPTREALNEVFGDIDLSKLQIEFERHIRSLK